MADIETIELDGLNFAEVAAPSTPSAASVIVYAKSDGKLYIKDDAGTETDLTAGGAASLSYVQNQLSADVAMASANTYYDGPAVTLSAGTWLLTGTVTHDGLANATLVTAKLWDGTTVAASCETLVYGGAAGRDMAALPLSAVVVIAAGTPTWKISVAANAVTTNIKAAAPENGAGNNASTLVAVKIA